MKCNKKDIENAILTLAYVVDKKESYAALIESNLDLPRLSEMIGYDLYLVEFNQFAHSGNVFMANELMLEYGRELRKNGFVNFKK